MSKRLEEIKARLSRCASVVYIDNGSNHASAHEDVAWLVERLELARNCIERQLKREGDIETTVDEAIAFAAMDREEEKGL